MVPKRLRRARRRVQYLALPSLIPAQLGNLAAFPSLPRGVRGGSLRHSRALPSFPRRREPRSGATAARTLPLSRLRDLCVTPSVIPAKAGIQGARECSGADWKKNIPEQQLRKGLADGGEVVCATGKCRTSLLRRGGPWGPRLTTLALCPWLARAARLRPVEYLSHKSKVALACRRRREAPRLSACPAICG